MPSNDRIGSVMQRRIFVLMTVCGIVIFAVLSVRLFFTQVLMHPEFEARAIEQQTRETPVTASRGTIYDRNGKPLAISASVETVYIDPFEIRQFGEDASVIARGLSGILGVDEERVYEMTQRTGTRYQTVKRKIEAEEAAAVRAFIADPDGSGNMIRSVHLEPDTRRYYPRGSLAAHIIGFVGTDNTGLDGVEAAYDSNLTGTDGRVVRLKNGSGTEMLFNDYENYFDARDGEDITLTIDAVIQHYVEKALEQAIIDYGVREGARAVAMDPRNGEILALASYVNYDLNDAWALPEAVRAEIDAIEDPDERARALSDAQYRQWRNRVLSDRYEPGSVFKIVTLAMALEEGVVNESDTFNCRGSINVIGRAPVHCHRLQGHGTQTLAEAVQNSCNCAFVEIGLRVGAEKFYEYVEAFGLNDRTGIDLGGEVGGDWWDDATFMDPENHSQIAAASFGQTFGITPLQMVTALSATVNGGYLYCPHVVGEIVDAGGNIVYRNEPEPVRQVISAETSATVRRLLENTVSDGSGRNAQVPGYRIGGKTGTSTDTVHEAETGVRNYTVSFGGIAPMEDPQIVILVILEQPSPQPDIQIYGSTMAAPVAGRILSDVLPYLNIAPQYTEDELRALNIHVPRLTGTTLENAEAQSRRVQLEVRIIGDGDTVTSQFPAANAQVAPGTRVILYTGGAEPETETAVMPDLSGRTYLNAKNMLEELGLFIRSSGVPASMSGAVVGVQAVPPGEEVRYGTVIDVVLVDRNVDLVD